MKKISKDILTNLNESYLEPKYDSAQSFYNKAMVDDSGDKLYSYGTLVAEVVDGKPIIHNAQSATTVRHIKEFLRQKGFEDELIFKAIKDFKKEKMNESFDSIQYWGSKNQFGYTIRQLRVDYDNRTFETGSFKQSVDHKVSNREIDRKIEELEALGFTNLNKQHAETDLERTEELYKHTPDERHRKDYENAKYNAKKNGVVKESLDYDCNEPNSMDTVRKHLESGVGGSILVNTYIKGEPAQDPPTKDDIGKVEYDLRVWDDGTAAFEGYEVEEVDEDEKGQYDNDVKWVASDWHTPDADGFDINFTDEEVNRWAKKVLGIKENIKEGSVYVLQGKYDTSWEDLVEYTDYKEARADYKAYEENEREYPHRIITRRVKNDVGGHRELRPNSDREKVSDNIEVMNYKGTYIVTYHGHSEGQFDNQEEAFKFAEKLKKKYKE